MCCKGCLTAIGITTMIVLLSGWTAARNLGRFLDVSQDAVTADAIVVMGGEGARFTRTQYAVDLYNAGVSPTVVFSGGTLLGSGLACTSTGMSLDEAAKLGLPRSAVVISGEAQSTYDEAQNIARLSGENGWQSLVLVTDRFHTRRSLRAMRSLMPNMTIVASSPDDPRFNADRWWNNEYSLVFAINEALKLGFYWKEYGIRPVW